MAKDTTRQHQAPENPVLEEQPHISVPPDKAAGAKGVTEGLKHILKHTKLSDAAKVLFKLNQKGGVDCPGCAWPDPDDDRSKLGEYCENGLKAIAEESSKRTIGADFFVQHAISDLASWSDYELGKSGRLAQPLVLHPDTDHYAPITWDAAFQLIGKILNDLSSPDEAIFYTSGRTSNEAAFLYQLFVREFGTNNLPDCSNMCHESSGNGLSETLGIGKGSVTLEDLHEAEVIMVMGQNPGTNHPRMLAALEQCKKNGGRIVTVNPLPEAGLNRFVHPQSLSSLVSGGTQLTDHFLQVKINGDVALLKAIMIKLLELDAAGHQVLDHKFIAEYTVGFEALKQDLQDASFDDCLTQSGINEATLMPVVQLLAEKKKIIICWAMGLTQHVNGVDNIREIVNLLLLKGAIGKPGAGTCPVRGHSNVQGDRTMGIWEAPKEAFLDKLRETFGFEPPRKHGYAVVDAIKAMHEGRSKVFFAMGGNFLSASPDTAYTAEALRRCDLTVQVSTKLNRSHLIHGKTALILPCLGRTEIDMQASGKQFVSVENSMGIVHQSKGVLKPSSSHLLSEPAIVAGVAKHTMGERSLVPWSDLVANYDLIRDLIEVVVPGFGNYNARVRQAAGFYLPNGARERNFKTASGKAQFSINPLPDHDLGEDAFWMMTIRSHDQFNTTIYGLDDRYRGIKQGRRIVLMNAEDMADKGLHQGDLVDLIGHHQGVERVARNFRLVAYDIPSSCIATYFPEANVLVPIDSYARRSKTPASKMVEVKMQASVAP